MRSSTSSLLVKPRSDQIGRPPAKRARAAEWLTGYLYHSVNHEARVKDITEDAGQVAITLHTLDRAAKNDVRVERFQRGGRGVWWWRLPEKTIELMDAAAEDDDDDE